MDTEKCAEMVLDRFWSHRCTRKPGYGKGGLYCKQHAEPAAWEAANKHYGI